MSNKIPFGKLSARMLKSWVKADMTGREWLVFMALHSHAEWGGKVFQTHKRMAESIGIKTSNFSLALKRLEAAGVIKRHKGFIQISPQVVEYGDWASAKEIVQRKARKQSCLDQQKTTAAASVSLPDPPSADHARETAQRGPLSFPSVTVQPGQTSSAVSGC